MEDKVIRSIGEGGFSKKCLVEHYGERFARKRVKITPGSLYQIDISFSQINTQRNK